MKIKINLLKIVKKAIVVLSAIKLIIETLKGKKKEDGKPDNS